MNDIEIARNTKLSFIGDIAKKLGLEMYDLELYGNYKAKISLQTLNRIRKEIGNGEEAGENNKNVQEGSRTANSDRNKHRDAKGNSKSKLILVTATSPTPAGEGKTTTTIGLGQALEKLGKKTAIALREPSLGPCFGIKGGATGGGYSQVTPMEDINLHFTGDLHAVTTAHNLVSALIDNHLNFGNKLNLTKVVWRRVLDLNDRSLRNVIVGVGDNAGVIREDGFMITAASEIMAVLCLAEDLMDLQRRLERIVVAYDGDDRPVTIENLGISGSLLLLLRDALRPNLVQTLEGTPTFIHGGPFANIAHGCNSVIATKTALHLADYVVTEAGFGADLGAEKFFDIKCREAGLIPDCVLLVSTCRSLKYNGGMGKKDLMVENMEALKMGIENLERHIANIKKFNIPLVVALNKFNGDSNGEVNFIINRCGELGVKAVICEGWARGGEGAINVAEAVLESMETYADRMNNDSGAAGTKNKEFTNILDKNSAAGDNSDGNFKFLYDLGLSLEDKVRTIAQEIYGAGDIVFGPRVRKKLKKYAEDGYGELPVCIAKTQYSFSDNPNLLGAPRDFTFTINDAQLSAGAGFVVCLAGDIMTMPGLPKNPIANTIGVAEDGSVEGLF